MALFSLDIQSLRPWAGYSTELLAIDYNRDGWTDLLFANMRFPLKDAGTPVGVVQNRSGTFRDAPSAVSGGPPSVVHPRELVVGDFNGDKRIDVFIADHGFDALPYPGRKNALLLGTSNGFVNASDRLPGISDFTHSADAADIDGDGDLDIYVGNIGGGTSGPYFLINDGKARFETATGRLPADISGRTSVHTTSLFIDADRDGDKDLFLGSDGTAPSKLLLNDGPGFFSEIASPLPPGRFGAANTIALDAKSFDFNKDKFADILVTSTRFNPSYTKAGLQALVSNRDGTFTDATARIFDAQPAGNGWSVYSDFVDLNNDGAKDIVCETNGSPHVIYINSGDNVFYRVNKPILPISGSIDALDANRDGWMDFISIGGQGSGRQIELAIRQAPSGVLHQGGGSADVILGGRAAETIGGGGGSDFLAGGAGGDRVRGESGNDKILGNSGNDRLYGGSGGDVLDGGPGKDVLYGETGNDILVGGTGIDTLFGGSGKDAFRFNVAPKAANRDVIKDFNVRDDTIQLYLDLFAGLGSRGSLAAEKFHKGKVAADEDDRIIYDPSTGHLFYDPDGVGGAGQVRFAQLSKKLKMTAADFLVL